MKRVTAIATATVLALLVALTLNVAAQQPDTKDRTIMTFSSAVELPRPCESTVNPTFSRNGTQASARASGFSTAGECADHRAAQ